LEHKMTYYTRFNFYDHAQRTANKRWGRNFTNAMRKAIRTAR